MPSEREELLRRASSASETSPGRWDGRNGEILFRNEKHDCWMFVVSTEHGAVNSEVQDYILAAQPQNITRILTEDARRIEEARVLLSSLEGSLMPSHWPRNVAEGWVKRCSIWLKESSKDA